MCNKKQRLQEFPYVSDKRGKIPLAQKNHGNYPVITIYGWGCPSNIYFMTVGK